MEREQLKGRQTPGVVKENAGCIYAPDAHDGDPVAIAGIPIHERKHAYMGTPRWQGGYYYATKEQTEANAALYREAHNVANRTGLWPLDMEQRIKELEGKLRDMVAAADLIGEEPGEASPAEDALLSARRGARALLNKHPI